MGVYSNISVDRMYSEVTQRQHDREHAALAWAEAENIIEIRDLLCSWFDAMENGTADKRSLDPRGPAVSLEEAEMMIAEIDDDFNKEKNRWESLEVEAGPDYFRLAPAAKIAFVQQILMTIKSMGQLEKEVWARQKADEQISPELFAPKQLPLEISFLETRPLGYTPANESWDYLG